MLIPDWPVTITLATVMLSATSEYHKHCLIHTVQFHATAAFILYLQPNSSCFVWIVIRHAFKMDLTDLHASELIQGRNH